MSEGDRAIHDDWESAEELLREWCERARLSQHSQHDAGKALRVVGYCVNVPSVVIPAVMGATALFLVNQTISNGVLVWFGIGGVVGALLTSLDLMFKFGERGRQHSEYGASYGVVRREVEEILALPIQDRGQIKECLDSIRGKLDRLGEESPVVAGWLFRGTKRRLAGGVSSGGETT